MLFRCSARTEANEALGRCWASLSRRASERIAFTQIMIIVAFQLTETEKERIRKTALETANQKTIIIRRC